MRDSQSRLEHTDIFESSSTFLEEVDDSDSESVPHILQRSQVSIGGKELSAFDPRRPLITSLR